MPGASLVELLQVAFPDQISGNADETVRGEIEREVPHALLEGPPDDIDHRGGVSTYGVIHVKDVTYARLEQIVMRGDGFDVVEHLGLVAGGDPGPGGHIEVAADARFLDPIPGHVG